MEWTMAKRFVIVLLVIINVALAGLNIQQRQDNNMTSAQEKAIFEVLSQNGITLYTDLNINAAPMFRLEARVPSYTKEELERAFFGGEKTKVSVGSQTTYKTGTKALTMEGDRGSFSDSAIARGRGELTKENAVKQAERKAEELKQKFGSLALNYVSPGEDGWKVEFCGVYNGETIFSNHFSVFVSEKGIYAVTFTYCEITGISREKKDICMIDEALLTFMREWNKQEKSNEAAIQKIELGYDLLEQGGAAAGTGLFLEPTYRIYLMEEAKPYLVNAYTSQIVNKEH